MTADTRIAYGAQCTWWGPIQEVGTKPSGLPCCPVCGGMLLEAPSEVEWWAGAKSYEANGHPRYTEFLAFIRNRHFANMDQGWAAFEVTI